MREKEIYTESAMQRMPKSNREHTKYDRCDQVRRRTTQSGGKNGKIGGYLGNERTREKER